MARGYRRQNPTGLCRAWRATQWPRCGARQTPGDPTATALQALAVLDEPFPTAVAQKLVDNLCTGRGRPPHRRGTTGRRVFSPAKPSAAPTDEPTESTDLLRQIVAPEGVSDPNSMDSIRWLRFADPATRLLARATGPSIAAREKTVAKVWSRVSPGAVSDAIRRLAVARHAARGRTPHPDVFSDAAAVALERGEPSQVDRWLKLYALHGGDMTRWHSRFARVAANLELDPSRVHREAIRELGRIAAAERDRARAALLMLRFENRRGDPRTTLRHGPLWAEGVVEENPTIAGQMRREVAVAAYIAGDFDTAVSTAEAALHDIRSATKIGPDQVPSLGEIDATCTLARIHLDQGNRVEALSLAEPLMYRCANTGRTRGEARLAVLLAEGA